jgi:hypothetical protein
MSTVQIVAIIALVCFVLATQISLCMIVGRMKRNAAIAYMIVCQLVFVLLTLAIWFSFNG